MKNITSETKTIRIFLSSTFNDMHAERDLIMQSVYPALQRNLADKDITVQFIDLRWGVNTQDVEETERENVVLRECIEEIRHSRPFFIGLLGNRYGWIPPRENWERVLESMSNEERQKINTGSPEPRSVTELEMLFGALADHDSLRRSIFCFRSDEVYKEMDEAALARFSDSDEEAQQKLQSLRQRITDQFNGSGYETNLFTYGCRWDGSRLTGMEELAAFLTETITREVLLYESSSEVITPQDLYPSMQLHDRKIIDSHTRHFVGRESLLTELLHHCEESRQTLLLKARDGFGKTALLCKLWELLHDSDHFLPLIHFTRSSAESRSPAIMLKKWLADPAIASPGMFPPGEDIGFSELAYHFKEAVSKIDPVKKVVLLIDDFHLIDDPLTVIQFNWLPENSVLLAFTHDEWPLLKYGIAEAGQVKLPLLTSEEGRSMVEEQLLLSGKRLPAKVMEQLIALTYRGFRCSSVPLWNLLMVRKLTQLSEEDFRAMKQLPGEDEAKKIEEYLFRLVQSAHPHPEPLFLSLIEQGESLFSTPLTWHTLKYLAASGNGLRESDLEILLGDHWDRLTFTAYRQWLGNLITFDSETGIIDFSCSGYRDILRMPDESMEPYRRNLLDHLGNYRDTHPLDMLCNREIPALSLVLSLGQMAPYLLSDPDSQLRKETTSRIFYALMNDQDQTMEWCREAVNAKPLVATELVRELSGMFLVIGQKDFALYLINFLMQMIHEKVEDQSFALLFEELRIDYAAMISESDPETAEKIANYLLDTGSQLMDGDERWMSLVIRGAELKVKLMRTDGRHEQVESMLSFASQQQLELAFTTETLDEKAFAKAQELMEQYCSFCREYLPETAEVADEQLRLFYSGEPWMFCQFRILSDKLTHAAFLHHCGDSFCSNLLMNEAEQQSQELMTLAPDNLYFMTAYSRARLLRCRYGMSSYFETDITLLEQLSCYAIDEAESLVAEWQIYLCESAMESTDIDLTQLLREMDTERLEKSSHPRVKASLLRILRKGGREQKKQMHEISPHMTLKIAETLLLEYNDPDHADHLLQLYHENKKGNPLPVDADEVMAGLLSCLIAAGKGDYDAIFTFYDTIHPFMKEIPTIAAFVRLNQFLYLRNLVVQSSATVREQRIPEARQLCENVRELAGTNTHHLGYTLFLQSCFYNYCSQVEFNMLPLLQSGKIDKAVTNLNELNVMEKEMRRFHYSGILMHTARSLAFAVNQAFYEESGQLPEALYYSKQHEYALYTIWCRHASITEISRRYAAALDNTGRLFITYFHDPHEADDYFSRSFPIFYRLYEENPSATTAEGMLVNLHNRLQTLYHAHKYEEAIEMARELFTHLRADGLELEQRTLAIIHDALSDHYAAVGNPFEEYNAIRKANEIFRQEVNRYPDNELAWRDLAQSQIRLGIFLWDSKEDHAAALSSISEAGKAIEKAMHIHTSLKSRMIHMNCLIRHAQMEMATENPQQAETLIDRFVESVRAGISEGYHATLLPILWEAMDRLFDVALQSGMGTLMRHITIHETKIKQQLIAEKILREEDALLESTLQKIKTVDNFEQQMEHLYDENRPEAIH